MFGCCAEHRQGEDEERLKVDVLLFAPDVLPQHCRVRRQDDVRDDNGSEGNGGRRSLIMLEPIQGAAVTHNGVPLKHEALLSPGDLVGLGQHYLFMFKDPTASDAPRTPAWITWLCPASEASEGGPRKAGRALSVRGRRRLGRPLLHWRDLEGRELCLLYALPQEDRLLEEILVAVDPAGEEPKLTPAFLLCLCIQHSAAHFKMADLRRLLLHIASQIQLAMWVSCVQFCHTLFSL